MRVKGCMNCYDGFRVDCFPENSSQVYGTAYKLGIYSDIQMQDE